MFWTSSCWYWRLRRQKDHAKSQALRVIQCYLKFVRFAVWSTESFFDLHHHFFNPRGPLNTIWEGYRRYEVFLVVQNAKLTISSGIFSFVFLLFPLLKLFKTGPKVDWGVRDPVYKQKSSSWPKANLKKTGNVSGNLCTGISTFTFFSQEFYIGTLLLLPHRFPTSILTWKEGYGFQRFWSENNLSVWGEKFNHS